MNLRFQLFLSLIRSEEVQLTKVVLNLLIPHFLRFSLSFLTLHNDGLYLSHVITHDLSLIFKCANHFNVFLRILAYVTRIAGRPAVFQSGTVDPKWGTVAYWVAMDHVPNRQKPRPRKRLSLHEDLILSHQRGKKKELNELKNSRNKERKR